jgi:hypothetical protein
MCHEILPTATITNRYATHSSPMCPYCKTVEEDRDHVMKCDHSSKRQWRLKCITSIRKRCDDMKTREMLTTILTDGIQAWFTEATLQPVTYPHAFRQLIQEQNDIGWRQLFNGRISNEWQRLQNEHLRRHGIKTITLTGQSWSTTVIVTIWKEFFALWEQRNNLVHGTDKSSHDLAKRSKAIAQIKHLHTQQNEVLAAHRSCMFMRDTEAELDSYLEPRRTNDLLNWVNTWKPAIAASVKSARVLAANTMKRIDEHFGYLTPSAKRPARSRVPPRFHTRHDGNRSSRRRLWKAPPSVRPMSAYFARIPTNKNLTPIPTAPSNTK